MKVDARLAHYEGTVILDAIVMKDGSVQAFHVRHPLGFGLVERAVAALGNWACKPSTRDGMPVDVQLQIQINFHLY